ncbi:hypothetical protein EVA_09805 [gut metagenome]|uniref:Uncharacterized protein n=1 Tax=gut metagenome TaxID=749906 RepID=J9GJB7_9ZZZZ
MRAGVHLHVFNAVKLFLIVIEYFAELHIHHCSILAFDYLAVFELREIVDDKSSDNVARNTFMA